MITGFVNRDGLPVISISIDGQNWLAIIDTGFNSDLELPAQLRSAVKARYFGSISFALAGDQNIVENAYRVPFPFDGEWIESESTFVAGRQILIGTRNLRNHRLEIDFPAKTVRLTRV